MITPEVADRIRAAIAKYPSARSAVLPALHIVQETYGWVPKEAQADVANLIGITSGEVSQVVSFYYMYFQKPVGKRVIKVCQSISCYLRGSDPIIDYLKKKLNVQAGETTPDGEFTLLVVECLASCGSAPVLQVNDDYYENLTYDKIDRILAGTEKSAAQLQLEYDEKGVEIPGLYSNYSGPGTVPEAGS